MKHLLSAKDLSRDAAIGVLDTAATMAQTQGREIKKLPALRGKTVVNLFFEDSTRTRISFEAAAKRLSADVINSPSRDPRSPRRIPKDTAQTCKRWAPTPSSSATAPPGRPNACDSGGSTRVVNAGDGTHQHPTQALLDAFTFAATSSAGRRRSTRQRPRRRQRHHRR